jgi:hypothetical protein
MATEIEPDFAYRHSIVDELFIKTADDNYVTARWCFTYGLNVDFFWLGVHALEKYLKASLLLNGSSGKDHLEGTKRKKYGHDIRKLYADVQPLAPELLPANLTRPPVIASVGWHDEPTEKFIGRLLFFGQADNRYQLYGYISRREAYSTRSGRLRRKTAVPAARGALPGQEASGSAGSITPRTDVEGSSGIRESELSP